jgi:predicted metal-dependent enzyme (double-stranded beta helix superfamily)
MLAVRTSFDLDQFIADCRAGLRDGSPQKAVRELVARAVAEPSDLMRAIGDPKRAEIQKLHQSSDLTVLNVVWAPRLTVMPHNHRMWAVIGVYVGREDNIFWRYIKDETGGKVEAAGAKDLAAGDAVPLGRDIIHSVTNPIPRFSGAIHVYGGDFFSVSRSEWDPESLCEQPYNVEKTLRMFEEANRYIAA